MTEPARHRVVIVGCGFGGLFAARALTQAPVDVTIIDRANHHLFQPLLYQVATGILPEGDIAPAIRDILSRHRNVSVQLAEVTEIDVAHRRVIAVQPGRVLETPYDSLIVASGVETSYFGHDEMTQWAPGMKSVDDALELRGRIFDAFEMAETSDDPADRTSWLTFVIVGGGPTGVEMAGQLIDLSRRALRGDFRAIDPATARVILVEGGDALLASFGPRISRIVARELGRLGVDMRLGCMVVGMDDGGVNLRYTDGRTERVDARTKVWAAGMTGSPLAKLLAEATGAEIDRMGRVKVLPDCTLPGHPEIACVGDMMALDDLPGLAEVAIQSGTHAAASIRRRLKGDDESKAFHYRDLGSMAAVSRFSAAAKIGPLSIGGFLGWCLWLVVHLTFLTGFKNRVAALVHWAIAFVGHTRAERVITGRQIAARQAVAAAASAEPSGQAAPSVGPGDLGDPKGAVRPAADQPGARDA